MDSCPFCEIATPERDACRAWETETLAVFADHRPIREGHVQIVTRAHYETFDCLPAPLAAEMVLLGQRIARVQKALYNVERVGFVFTGNEVAHVHAHVLPLHARDDITSARYGTGAARYVSSAEQAKVAAQLRLALAAQSASQLAFRPGSDV
ncbi:MAG: HIT family protein [Pseudomonadota bacterium]